MQMFQRVKLGSSTWVLFAAHDMHFYGLAIYHISGQKNAEKRGQEWKLLLAHFTSHNNYHLIFYKKMKIFKIEDWSQDF